MAESVEVTTEHRTLEQLQAGLEQVLSAPQDAGTLEMIVARPAVDERVLLASGELDVERGLVADRWSSGSRPNPKAMLTVMNARASQLVAGDRSRWALAGDQLYADFDLSPKNIPPGTRLAIGSAVIEVTDQPHLGCEKFSSRFGQTAREFANSPAGTAASFRGINTRVVQSGTVHVGDVIRKLA
ncbi:MAG TPA: MOSC domain-containing protein [Candidatus Dormibacteraeota bacterium]|nr:MOSC domain-containing protein [Candidatus Dormibacteraeota bacterium]